MAAASAAPDGRLRDASLRAEASAFEIDEMAFGLTIERIDETKAGQNRSVIVILKMYGTELNKLRQELFMAIGATDALNFDTDSKALVKKVKVRLTLSKAAPEVQLNIIAKRILGLPAWGNNVMI